MPTSRPGYRTDLEALRGLAILLVVAYHAGVPALAGGFVGVDVFFVLSGYFTARFLVQEYGTTGSVGLLAFWGRRALRLLPVLLVVVTATLVAVWTVWAPIDRAEPAETARAVLLGLANNAFAREAVNYFGGASSPFLHAWSLAVDLQTMLSPVSSRPALSALSNGGIRRRARTSPVRAHRGVGVGRRLRRARFPSSRALWTTRASWAVFADRRAWESSPCPVGLTLPPHEWRAAVAGNADGLVAAGGGLAIVVGSAALCPLDAVPARRAPARPRAVRECRAPRRGALGAQCPVLRATSWFGECRTAGISALAHRLHRRRAHAGYVGTVALPTALWPGVSPTAGRASLLRAAGRPGDGTRWVRVGSRAACSGSRSGAMRHAATSGRAADQRAFAAARIDRMPHTAGQHAGTPRGARLGLLLRDPAVPRRSRCSATRTPSTVAALDRLARARVARGADGEGAPRRCPRVDGSR